ncbi:hypothetical protein ASF36_22640 [Methylobacterium sp. Leaf90]|nr:hypothetical protein ASF36_22640 [Methylobacterium sp. Leaf90]
MATSETLIDLELEYASLRKVRQDLLTGKLKSGYTHTSNGSQSVTYNLVVHEGGLQVDDLQLVAAGLLHADVDLECHAPGSPGPVKAASPRPA